MGHHLHAAPRPYQQRPRRNAIQAAVETWVGSLDAPQPSDAQAWRSALLQSAPKRFTLYEPMALLPAGSFASPPWTAETARRDEASLAALWSLVLAKLSQRAKAPLTHLAVNEGIPRRNKGDNAENVRRSPGGLRMLSGDFGPAQADAEAPSQDDLDRGLWVTTKQNGILQTWAPRWTMFSRGNVKEKARLLGFPGSSKQQAGDVWAVDLYAGIGYFAFCYASLGMRVLCWEINPWSVEGLRRGARANGWTVKVVQGQDLARPLRDLMAGDEQIVVFLESNQEALKRVQELQAMGLAEDVRHVNCGLLPTSEPTWEAAWEMTRLSSESWLHLHENVGANDIEARRCAVQGLFAHLSTSRERDRSPAVEHVELVKTFAPGVWHCVFDVRITNKT